eukprot:1142261-Pelagomonas_calceolata.AAC.7
MACTHILPGQGTGVRTKDLCDYLYDSLYTSSPGKEPRLRTKDHSHRLCDGLYITRLGREQGWERREKEKDRNAHKTPLHTHLRREAVHSGHGRLVVCQPKAGIPRGSLWASILAHMHTTLQGGAKTCMHKKASLGTLSRDPLALSLHEMRRPPRGWHAHAIHNKHLHIPVLT